MLVITRKVGERIVGSQGIVIHLLGVVGRKAQIGIQAPESLRFVRAEIVQGGIRPHVSALKERTEFEQDTMDDGASVQRDRIAAMTEQVRRLQAENDELRERIVVLSNGR